jgi:hypothetical protein
MRQHSSTLPDGRLAVDETLDGAAHATMTDEPHRMGNPLTTTAHPRQRREHARTGWPADLIGFPVR